MCHRLAKRGCEGNRVCCPVLPFYYMSYFWLVHAKQRFAAVKYNPASPCLKTTVHFLSVPHVSHRLTGCSAHHSCPRIQAAAAIQHVRRGVLWNSAFSWVYLSLSPLLFIFLLSSAICKSFSDNHFALLLFFFFRMALFGAFVQRYGPCP